MQDSYNTRSKTWEDVLVNVLSITVNCGVAYFAAYYLFPRIINRVLDSSTSKTSAFSTMEALAKKLNRKDLADFIPNKYESIILQDVCSMKSSNITFADVGGLDTQIDKIRESVIVPIKMWEKFKHISLSSQYPSGMLLYGRPGTGKTLCVKALANETDAILISIKSSTLMDKYFGESQKLVTALFSLARRLGPTIIFVDEIDTLIKKRGNGGSSGEGHDGHDGLQGAFLAEWDGLKQSEESNSPPVIVIGATNR